MHPSREARGTKRPSTDCPPLLLVSHLSVQPLGRISSPMNQVGWSRRARALLHYHSIPSETAGTSKEPQTEGRGKEGRKQQQKSLFARRFDSRHRGFPQSCRPTFETCCRLWGLARTPYASQLTHAWRGDIYLPKLKVSSVINNLMPCPFSSAFVLHRPAVMGQHTRAMAFFFSEMEVLDACKGRRSAA